MDSKWRIPCKVIGVIWLVLGIIASAYLADKLGYTTYRSGISEMTERSNFMVCVIFLVGLIYTCVPTLMLFALSDLLDGVGDLPSIFKKIVIDNELKKAEDELAMNGKWKCENCGKVNGNYVGTCSCGTSKK